MDRPTKHDYTHDPAWKSFGILPPWRYQFALRSRQCPCWHCALSCVLPPRLAAIFWNAFGIGSVMAAACIPMDAVTGFPGATIFVQAQSSAAFVSDSLMWRATGSVFLLGERREGALLREHDPSTGVINNCRKQINFFFVLPSFPRNLYYEAIRFRLLLWSTTKLIPWPCLHRV